MAKKCSGNVIGRFENDVDSIDGYSGAGVWTSKSKNSDDASANESGVPQDNLHLMKNSSKTISPFPKVQINRELNMSTEDLAKCIVGIFNKELNWTRGSVSEIFKAVQKLKKDRDDAEIALQYLRAERQSENCFKVEQYKRMKDQSDMIEKLTSQNEDLALELKNQIYTNEGSWNYVLQQQRTVDELNQKIDDLKNQAQDEREGFEEAIKSGSAQASQLEKQLSLKDAKVIDMEGQIETLKLQMVDVHSKNAKLTSENESRSTSLGYFKKGLENLVIKIVGSLENSGVMIPPESLQRLRDYFQKQCHENVAVNAPQVVANPLKRRKTLILGAKLAQENLQGMVPSDNEDVRSKIIADGSESKIGETWRLSGGFQVDFVNTDFENPSGDKDESDRPT